MLGRAASPPTLSVFQIPTMNVTKHTSYPPLFLPLSFPPLLFSSQASHLSVSLWCSGTASEACGRSTKPGPGFGAWLLSVERDPGPLRAEGWERRVEGRWWGWREGGEQRQRAVQFWITFKELQSQWRGWIPLRREGEKKGSVQRERERERHGRHETRGKCESAKRERKEVVWVITSFPLSLSFSLPLFLSLHGMHALALHTAGYTEMIYLCAGAGRHGKSGPHKGVVVPPWSFL